jgi:hypothetical protein
MSDKQEQEPRKARALAVLEAYGADSARWPDADRRDLVEFIMADALLSERMREEKALDHLLAKAPLDPPSYALQTRILDRFPGRQAAGGNAGTRSFWRQIMDVLWPYGSATVPAGALAVSILLGSTVGALTSTATNGWSEEQSYDVVALALGEMVLTGEWQ